MKTEFIQISGNQYRLVIDKPSFRFYIADWMENMLLAMTIKVVLLKESDSAYMLIRGVDGKCYVCLCTLDAHDKIVGIKEKKTLKDFILELLQNIE